jgi:hypothetical protein
MAQTDDSSRRRNVVIGWSLAALLLAALGFYYFYEKGQVEYPGDSVNVTVKKIELPNGFEDAFKGFTGLLLVDEAGNVTAITPKGQSIDLCGPGSKNGCKVVLTTYALVDALRGSLQCGRCSSDDELVTCHKDTQKYPCHTRKRHHSCECS